MWCAWLVLDCHVGYNGPDGVLHCSYQVRARVYTWPCLASVKSGRGSLAVLRLHANGGITCLDSRTLVVYLKNLQSIAYAKKLRFTEGKAQRKGSRSEGSPPREPQGKRWVPNTQLTITGRDRQ